MTKYIGRLFNIALCKETTRGTLALSAVSTYFVAATGRTWDEEVDTVVDESNVGVIEDSIDSHITARRSKGSFDAITRDQSLGLVLLGTMGQEAALGAVETGVKDHNFVILESAQHQALSFFAVDPNDSAGKGFPLGMIDTFDLDFEIGKFCTYKAAIATQVHTTMAAMAAPTTYVNENIFLPQHANVYISSTYSGLASGAVVTNLKKGTISVKKNTEDDQVIGTLDPADRLNKQFTIEGQLEITYNDRVMIDTYLLADASTALRVKLVNTDITIGATSKPTLTIDLARCKLMSVARKIDNNNIVTETVKFKAYYSISDAIMAKMILRNTVTSLY